MNNELFNLWKRAKTPLDYIILIYLWLLLGISISSFIGILYLFITEPQRISNISFGLIDYI